MAANTVPDLKNTNKFASGPSPELPGECAGGGADLNQSFSTYTTSLPQATAGTPANENFSLPSPHTNNNGNIPSQATILQTSDDKANKELFARFDRLTRHRERVLTLRMKLDYELSRLDHCRRFFSEAVEELMKFQQDSINASSLPPAETMMDVKHAYDALAQQNQLVTRQGHDLSEREYKLARLEGLFCRKARQVLGSLFPEKSFDIPRALPWGRRQEPSEGTSDVPTSINQHPLLQAYFDAAGEVGVYSERLAELDFEYKEERTQRNLREDQELPVDPPEHEFEQQYRDERLQIESDLSRAILRSENLRQSCRQEGLDPDESRKASSAGQSSYLTSTVPSEISAVPSRDLIEVFEALAGPDVSANQHALRYKLLMHDAPEEAALGGKSEDQINQDQEELNRAKIEGWREAVERDMPKSSDSDLPEAGPLGEPPPATETTAINQSETGFAPQSPNHDEGYGSHSQRGSIVASHGHVILPVGPLSPPSTVVLQRVRKTGNKQIDLMPAILPTRQLIRTFSDPELQRWRVGSPSSDRFYSFTPGGEIIPQRRPVPPAHPP